MSERPVAERWSVGSLFSGIGGFDLGLERAGFTVKWQVEIDGYATKVLSKHWPNIPKYGDIRAIAWEAVEPVRVLCGGFPCQDLSYAGKRAGLREGTRSGLWFEYLRAIRSLRPKYIVVENVPGLLDNHALGRVLGDLAESGYDAEWDCIPAASIGAFHQRDRVWIVAYPARSGCEGNNLICTNSQGVREGIFSQLSGSSYLRKWEGWEAEPGVGRVANGISNKTHRLRGLGNAIVPQIAEAIGRMIRGVEHE